MTEQRFDIIVTDKVDASVNTKITAIGTSADSAAKSLRALNQELAQNSASAANAAATAATRAAAATAKVQVETAGAATAQARLSAEQDKASASGERLAQAQAKTALAQEKVATQAAKTAEAQSRANVAYLKEEEALNRAVAAEERAIASKEKLSAVSNKTVAPNSTQTTATVIGSYNSIQPANRAPNGALASAQAQADAIAAETRAAANVTKVATEEVTSSVQQMEEKTSTLFQRFKASATGAFDSVRDFASGNGTRFRSQANELGAGAETASSKLGTMGNKAGMTALSIRELLVVAREGGRGDFTRMAGSLSILAMSLDVLAPALVIAGAGFVTLYAARKTFNTDGEQQSLKVYADTLGLTSKEMRKLSDTTLDAKGNLKELNLVQLEYTDVAKGLFQTVKNQFEAMVDTSKGTASSIGSFFSSMFDYALKALNAFGAAVEGGFKTMIALAEAGADSLTNPFKGAAEAAKAVANAPGLVKKAYDDATASQKKFNADWRKNADEAAKDRLKAEADAIIANRNPKKEPKGPKPWDRAGNLEEDNSHLDEQIKSLNDYGQALTEANALEQLSRKYREHNVPLTQAETKALQDKIHAYEDGKRVQAEMTAQEEAANGPQRKYYDTMDALDKLLAKGAITTDQYASAVKMAGRAFDDATNPLAALNRELEKNARILDAPSKDKGRQEYIEQLRAAAEAKSQSIFEPGPKTTTDANGVVVNAPSRKLTAQAQGMVDEHDRQDKQGKTNSFFDSIDPKKKNDDPSSSGYLLKNYKKMYAEIDKMRNGDVKNEAEAAERKKNLDRAVGEAKLAAASDIFGQLATLSTSKNKELAAIGKAAAVAQATIDGFAAVQKALASAPPPFNYALAAAVGIATAANVAKIAGVGFQGGGYTGDGAVNEQAGPVHRGEYVFDASATRRLGVANLEALRSGNTLSKPGMNGGSGTNVTIMPQPGVYMEPVQTSDDHIVMLAKRTVSSEAPRAVANNLRGGSNSHMGRAMHVAYGLARSDR